MGHLGKLPVVWDTAPMPPPHGVPVNGIYKFFVFPTALGGETDVFSLVSRLARSMLMIKTHTHAPEFIVFGTNDFQSKEQ